MASGPHSFYPCFEHLCVEVGCVADHKLLRMRIMALRSRFNRCVMGRGVLV